jgi:anti-anti-sigma regulatory factor
MLKAQYRELGDQVVLQVCGRLAEGWVAELEGCWQTAMTEHPNHRLCVDLRGVTFIDPKGESLLRSMHRNGASFQASGLLIQEVIHQITGSSK